MKFESKFGIGEICIYNDYNAGTTRQIRDVLVKVIGVIFEGSNIAYTVENITTTGEVQRFVADETLLTGDPDFCQLEGYKEP